MGRRSAFLSVSCWLGLSFLLVGSCFYQQPNEQFLLQLSQEFQSKVEKSHYHFSGRVKEGIRGKQLEQWVQKLQSALSFPAIKKQIAVDGIRYHAEKRTAGRWYRLQIINDCPKDQFVYPYLVLLIEEQGISKPDWLIEKEVLQFLMQSFGIFPDYHISYQWELENVSNLQGEIDQVLTYLNAKRVEGMDTERTSSVSAQSPMLVGRIATGENWMNVQVAARWSDDHSRIIMTVGTPIITMEY